MRLLCYLYTTSLFLTDLNLNPTSRTAPCHHPPCGSGGGRREGINLPNYNFGEKNKTNKERLPPPPLRSWGCPTAPAKQALRWAVGSFPALASQEAGCCEAGQAGRGGGSASCALRQQSRREGTFTRKGGCFLRPSFARQQSRRGW